MSYIQAIILGFVQGATEFLPVSSSGHLAILKNIFGLSEIGITFDIFLHVGTLAAVFLVYYKDIWELIKNLFCIIGCVFFNIDAWLRNIPIRYDEDKIKYKKVISNTYRRFVLLAVVSTIPVAIVGFLFEDYIESVSEGLLVPGICLLITGVVLLIADALPGGNKNANNMTYKNAVAVGICQACAVFPGISRSGSTISGALISGLNRDFAVKYSFILSIPAILGAALLSVVDIAKGEVVVESDEIGMYVVGMVIAAVVGYFAIKFLLVLVRKKKFKWFSLYCFAVGIFAIIGNFVIK